MPIIRVSKRKDNPYVIIDRRPLDDERLSWKARGLLAHLLSKPDKWEVNVKNLIDQAPDGRDSVRAGLRELRDVGYVDLRPKRAENGQTIGQEYVVNEVPTERREIRSSVEPDRETDNPALGEAHRETGFPSDGKSVPIVSNEIPVNNNSNYLSTPPISPPSDFDSDSDESVVNEKELTLPERYGSDMSAHPAVIAYTETFPEFAARIHWRHREMIAAQVDPEHLSEWQTILDRWAGTIGYRPDKLHNLLDAYQQLLREPEIQAQLDGTTASTWGPAPRSGRNVHQSQAGAGRPVPQGVPDGVRVQNGRAKRPGEYSRVDWLRNAGFTDAEIFGDSAEAESGIPALAPRADG